MIIPNFYGGQDMPPLPTLRRRDSGEELRIAPRRIYGDPLLQGGRGMSERPQAIAPTTLPPRSSAQNSAFNQRYAGRPIPDSLDFQLGQARHREAMGAMESLNNRNMGALQSMGRPVGYQSPQNAAIVDPLIAAHRTQQARNDLTPSQRRYVDVMTQSNQRVQQALQQGGPREGFLASEQPGVPGFPPGSYEMTIARRSPGSEAALNNVSLGPTGPVAQAAFQRQKQRQQEMKDLLARRASLLRGGRGRLASSGRPAAMPIAPLPSVPIPVDAQGRPDLRAQAIPPNMLPPQPMPMIDEEGQLPQLVRNVPNIAFVGPGGQPMDPFSVAANRQQVQPQTPSQSIMQDLSRARMGEGYSGALLNALWDMPTLGQHRLIPPVANWWYGNNQRAPIWNPRLPPNAVPGR